jgi:predicted Rdx family selenoprotein
MEARERDVIAKPSRDLGHVKKDLIGNTYFISEIS